jgi:hypothetical protein
LSGFVCAADLYTEIGVVQADTSLSLLYTSGGPQAVVHNGNNTLLGFPTGGQTWFAMAFKLAEESTIELLTAYWFAIEGAEAEVVRYIIWRRTGLNRPVDGDQVAMGTAGPFTFSGNGPNGYFRRYDVNLPLPAGDYWLTLYADGGVPPNTLAWLTGGDKADVSLERDGMWRSRMFPNPGFENFRPPEVECGPYMTDCEDRWNLCFALWGTTSGAGGCLELGDCNQDGRVDLRDLAMLLGCFNAGTCCDTDGDGTPTRPTWRSSWRTTTRTARKCGAASDRRRRTQTGETPVPPGL